MPLFLIHFAQQHETFQLPELESVASIFRIPLSKSDLAAFSPEIPLLVVELEGDEQAKQLASRCVLVK